MIRSKVDSVGSFTWQLQLSTSFVSHPDHLRCCPRLVITPLTERFYATGTQALNSKIGCAPTGPDVRS
eukprot:scaffold7863_cov37-Cyclotella_meneghiniana.AAC.12